MDYSPRDVIAPGLLLTSAKSWQSSAAGWVDHRETHPAPVDKSRK
jgi:hypothetical protein